MLLKILHPWGRLSCGPSLALGLQVFTSNLYNSGSERHFSYIHKSLSLEVSLLG